MQLSRLPARKPRRKQSGMTLLVGLILLVMLIVISTVGYRNTTMSERMTGNAVDRNVSFQSAENAGKEAVQAIKTAAGRYINAVAIDAANPAISSAAAGLFPQQATPAAAALGGTTSFWTKGTSYNAASLADCFGVAATSFSWTNTCAARVATKYANNASNAQYVIELLAQSQSGGSTSSTYRITSRSTGGSDTADVVIQTQFVWVTTP